MSLPHPLTLISLCHKHALVELPSVSVSEPQPTEDTNHMGSDKLDTLWEAETSQFLFCHYYNVEVTPNTGN